MKLDEPLTPNKLPDAPLPNAAPISAPFPCCKSTKPITLKAAHTCTIITIVSIFSLINFIAHYFQREIKQISQLDFILKCLLNDLQRGKCLQNHWHSMNPCQSNRHQYPA